jgi:hypothetical protein
MVSTLSRFSQPPMSESIPYEVRVNLAIESLECNHFQNETRAAKAYNVNRNTLANRMSGMPQKGTKPHPNRKLSTIEEDALLRHLIDMDERGFSLRPRDLAEMANVLIAEDTRQARDKVGKNWPTNFISRHPEIKTRVNRKYDYQRAQCEDPEIIQGWFRLVANTKAKYGIQDQDIYNFDETGFMMGIIQRGMVITATERRSKPKRLQQGNRDWTTVIEAINGRDQESP